MSEPENMHEAVDENSISFSEFLLTVPPGETRTIEDLAPRRSEGIRGESHFLKWPELRLHCDNQSCNGARIFRRVSGGGVNGSVESAPREFFMKFGCSNCRSETKTYSLWACRTTKDGKGKARKYGEFPAFGPRTPNRLLRLIGKDREIFLKGRTSENQGLGIGAFGYYRRVVENQATTIFDEIIKVAERIGLDENANISISLLQYFADPIQDCRCGFYFCHERQMLYLT